MKKLPCTLMLAMLALNLAAQTNRPYIETEVHKDESFVLSREFSEIKHFDFLANDSIILDENFFRKSQIQNMSNYMMYDCNMNLTVDGIGVYPPTQGQTGGPESGDKGCVGALGGSVDVGAIGGAAYSIPVELPVGVNGMAPSLALSYNSQGGNGLLGWKWELSGLSSITRTGKTLYHDGAMGGVSLSDDSDRFVLDGQRLIRLEDYTDSVDFKTEQDGLARIRAYVDKKTYYSNGSKYYYEYIDYFKVWNPDGTILEYGRSADSRIDYQTGWPNALCWLLNKVTDRNGNSTEYYYTEQQETGEFYIDSIQYTSNKRLSIVPEFTVKFAYLDKLDYEFGYVAGHIVQQKKLLSNISVTKRGAGELMRYTMDYSAMTGHAMSNYKDNHVYHRLVGINLEKGGMALNPTKICWERDETPVYQSSSSYKTELDTAYLDNFIFVGDFNADGFSDIITVPYKNEGCSTYPGPVNMNVLVNQGDAGFSLSTSLSMGTANGNPLASNLDWIHVLDINDDGFDDIILQYYTKAEEPSHFSYTTLDLFINQSGERFVAAWDGPIGSPHKLYLTCGDFLGEGKQSSVAFVLNDSISSLPIMEPLFYIHCDNGTCSHDTISNPDAIIANDVTVGDFTGNGKTEILVAGQDAAWMYRLTRSGGNYLFDSMRRCPEIVYVPELNLFPGDYNGDGKTDLLCYGSQCDTGHLGWFFLFSTGTAFAYKKTRTFYGISLAPAEKIYTYSLEKLYYGGDFAMFSSDFDGDGLCDIALSYKDDGEYYVTVFSKFVHCSILTYGNYGETILIEGQNPLSRASLSGIRTRSQYLHVGNFFSKDNMSFLGNEAAPRNSVQPRVPVLCSLYSLHEYNSVTCVTDGLGNKTRMSYRYPASAGVQRTALGNGVCRVNIPFRTIDSVTVFKANDARYATVYSYEDALLHEDGHGYLGFLKEEALSKVNGMPVGKHTTTYETGTMGSHAFSLPVSETVHVYVDGGWRTSMQRSYEFRKVTCTRNQKVVKPAVTRQTSLHFNFDTADPNDLLRKEIVEYDYSFGTGSSYANSYNCTETRTGIDPDVTCDFSSCEFKTVESFNFYSDQPDPWIINRLHIRRTTRSRTGKPDVCRSLWYEYTSNDSYQVKRNYDSPSLSNQDPLMIETNYEYYEEGNLKEKMVRVPLGQQNEHGKTFVYEYGPGEGADNQHRLLTKETVSSGSLSYLTGYRYDVFDRIDTIVGSNGLATAFENDALGTATKTVNADGTQSCSAMRWAEGYDYAPQGAMYFRWSRSSGSNKVLTFYHKTGVELRSVMFGPDNEAVIVDKKYDDRGRLDRVSNPYKEGETVHFTKFKYDNLDRLWTTTTPDGTATITEYLGSLTKTTVTGQGSGTHESKITVNAMGWTVRSDDASDNSYVTYDHYADGLLATATVNGDSFTTVYATYDNARNRSTLADPNYGTLTTVYNAYGELCHRISPKELENQQETSYQYDGMGRLVRETNGMENTTTHYIFEEQVGIRKGTLKFIHHKTVNGQAIQYLSYEYDEYARLKRTIEERPSCTYVTSMDYDECSRIRQTTYPTGVSVKNHYENGFLKHVLDADNNVLWTTVGTDACGQLTDATLGNGVTTHRAYKPEMHYLDSIVTSNNLQNLSYGYDNFGNLASRKDNLRNLEETFRYDKMNRLTDIFLGSTQSQICYDPIGRMTSKQADGQCVFTSASFTGAQGQPARPHAMKSAETTANVFPAATQAVTYTSFDKVKTIHEGGNGLEYTYGYDRQRIRMTDTVGGTTRNKDYVGMCEYLTEDDGNAVTTKTRTYLAGPFGVFAVVERQDGEETVHYILKDNLGSWTTIIDDEGNVEQELSFDAWGNLRNPETWSGGSSAHPMFDRGYTGHEHIAGFGLINMNGRCYDPLTSAFLSVDAYVQDPASAQAFNRYAYCSHNPLRFTDPTGWYQQPGTYGINPNFNPGGHTTYHSDDPNDMLWGRTSHPCANSSSGCVNGNAVTRTEYSQGNTSTSNGGVGGFYDQNGNYLGSDKYNNGKVYVLRSEIPEVVALTDEILNFFNEESSALTWNDIYNCFVEILPSRLSRNRMYDIVSQDDGKGGTKECNNREYGGYIDEYGFPVKIPDGEIKDPCIEGKITIEFPDGIKYATFHSHPSGNCESTIYDDHTSTPIFRQSPTPDDYAIAGNHICYVFGRRDGNVYVYNRKGVQSIIKTSDFVSPTKFTNP